MPSPPSSNRARQRGYSLMEVMIASVVLSIMVLGMSGFWYTAVGRASDLVLRQKAIFVLNAEMERISSLYVYTSFYDEGGDGPQVTTGYDSLAGMPTGRLIYPPDVSDYTNSGDYVTTTVTTFQSTEFHVYLDDQFVSANDRTYVWLDRSRSIVGRISWATSPITTGSCAEFDGGSGSDNCLLLSVFLEYPYKFLSTGAVTAPAASAKQTLSLKTIVGRDDG